MMNETKDNLVVSEISETNPLKPTEGFFVKALAEGAYITFNAPSRDKTIREGFINMELLENGKLIDRLIVKREGESLEKLMLKENSTKIDVLINNAGILPKFDRFQNYTIEEIKKAMDINFYSAVYSMHALLPMLLESESPAIINVDSSAALMSLAGTSVYSASKSALKAMTESIREELRGKCYVGIICPGFTKTDIFRNQSESDDKAQKALNMVSTSCERMVKMIMSDIRTRRPLGVHGFDAAFMNYFGRITPVQGGRLFSAVMKASKLPLFDPVFKDKE